MIDSKINKEMNRIQWNCFVEQEGREEDTIRGFKSRKEGYTASSWERSGKEDFLPQTS